MDDCTRSYWLFWVLVVVLFALTVAGVWYRWGWVPPERIHTLMPEPGCDLHRGPCEAAEAGGGRIGLSITPRPIPVLDELQLAVTVQGVEAEAVEVWFTGVDVDMGLLRYSLSETGTGVFRGRAWLSVCSQRQMTWQVQVRVDGPQGLVLAPFRFDTVYRRGFTLVE